MGYRLRQTDAGHVLEKISRVARRAGFHTSHRTAAVHCAMIAFGEGQLIRSVWLVRFTDFALTSILGVSGCGLLALNSSTNSEADDTKYTTIASAIVDPGHRGRDDTLVILSLSGGGSRAAYLSAKVMFELENWVYEGDKHLLAEVDAISSVSGGSLPAAYYAITRDPGQAVETPGPVRYRVWNERKVLRAMKKNYILKWFANWFWPHNIARYWLTDFDRTDIMAKTFADNMFDRPGLQRDYTIGQLNPERPHLVLNATNATAGKVSPEHHEARTYTKQSNANLDHADLEAAAGRTQFGSPFRFTQEQFAEIHSDIRDYSLARAVMATASFPAVFNYMTLRDYSSPDGRYVHLFDGGSSDNQGLSGVLEILERSACQNRGTFPSDDDCVRRYEKVVVIFVDAYTGTGGVSADNSDGRSFADFVIDTNFIDATESLLFANRDQRTNAFYEAFEKYLHAKKKGNYYHITLDDIEDPDMRRKAQQVGTSFSLSDDNAGILREAVVELMNASNVCLLAIEALLRDGSHDAEPNCKNPPRN